MCEMLNYANMKTSLGYLISPRELAGGTKNILIMMFGDDSVVCDMTFSGDNCNKYIPEILKTKDLVLCSQRFYNPWYRVEDQELVSILNKGVLIINDGYTAYNQQDYLVHLVKSGLLNHF